MDDQLREWAKLPKHDPAKYLRELLALMARGVHAGWDKDSDKRKRLLLLRGQGLKMYREMRDACLFCIGMGQFLKLALKVIHVPRENGDTDSIAFWKDGEVERYCPIQLKELPPAELSPDVTLDKVLEKFRKYTDSMDTIGAVYLNRKIRLDPSTFHVPEGLKMAGIWLFGSTTPKATDWILYGNLLTTPQLVTYKLKI